MILILEDVGVIYCLLFSVSFVSSCSGKRKKLVTLAFKNWCPPECPPVIQSRSLTKGLSFMYITAEVQDLWGCTPYSSPPRWLTHYLKHPGPLFQVIQTVTKFFYLRDAEKNGIFHPGVPSVVSNHVTSSSSLPSVLYTDFWKSNVKQKQHFRRISEFLLEHCCSTLL